MNRLFWGLFFVVLDFELSLGSATIGLLPDFLGYYLLMKGMEELAEESKYFDRGRHGAFAMAVASVIFYVTDLLELSSVSTVGFWFLGLAGCCAGMYVLHQMVSGIRQLEESYGCELQGEKLKSMWLIQSVMSVISYLLNWVPLVSVFAALAAAVTAVCMLAAMYGTKKRWKGL